VVFRSSFDETGFGGWFSSWWRGTDCAAFAGVRAVLSSRVSFSSAPTFRSASSTFPVLLSALMTLLPAQVVSSVIYLEKSRPERNLLIMLSSSSSSSWISISCSPSSFTATGLETTSTLSSCSSASSICFCIAAMFFWAAVVVSQRRRKDWVTSHCQLDQIWQQRLAFGF
jgi:beta-glucanase (GH16 family)